MEPNTSNPSSNFSNLQGPQRGHGEISVVERLETLIKTLREVGVEGLPDSVVTLTEGYIRVVDDLLLATQATRSIPVEPPLESASTATPTTPTTHSTSFREVAEFERLYEDFREKE